MTFPTPDAGPRGRIRDDDIASVREAARVEDIIAEHVTLKRAGSGGLVGLCPFHDERSPSFHVTPARQFWFCFGCGQGGDAISFLRQIEHLSFTEAVQRLAERYHIQLRTEEGGRGAPALPPGQRARLAAANEAAAAFYREQLGSPSAQLARDYMAERGFDAAALERFEVGFSPEGWDGLLRHLRGAGFGDEEISTAGLAIVRESGNGIYDRFRGRLMWPIRDLSSDVIGFGARKLREDDQGPKYLNTPETPLYRKSDVLYGIHAARKNIATSKTAVVVEGYTDVMACHLSGVGSAVAACGTAFGPGHIRVLRRLILDTDMYSGRVVFTFDGDAAGQKAALRAFKENERFTASTYVAIAPEGMDPSEMRQKRGDEAVQALIDQAVPLAEFALRTAIKPFDYDTVEGRVGAVRAAAPILAGLRDLPMRTQYTAQVSGWLGVDERMVRDEVSRATRGGTHVNPVPPTGEPAASGGSLPRPDPRDPTLAAEREALKLFLQEPATTAGYAQLIEDSAFTHEAYLRAWHAVRKTGESGGAQAARDEVSGDGAAHLLMELSMEPLPVPEVSDSYAREVLVRLLDRDCDRRIAALKARMAQGSGDTESTMADIVALQKHRQELRAWARG